MRGLAIRNLPGDAASVCTYHTEKWDVEDIAYVDPAALIKTCANPGAATSSRQSKVWALSMGL